MKTTNNTSKNNSKTQALLKRNDDWKNFYNSLKDECICLLKIIRQDMLVIFSESTEVTDEILFIHLPVINQTIDISEAFLMLIENKLYNPAASLLRTMLELFILYYSYFYLEEKIKNKILKYFEGTKRINDYKIKINGKSKSLSITFLIMCLKESKQILEIFPPNQTPLIAELDIQYEIACAFTHHSSAAIGISKEIMKKRDQASDDQVLKATDVKLLGYLREDNPERLSKIIIVMKDAISLIHREILRHLYPYFEVKSEKGTEIFKRKKDGTFVKIKLKV